MEQKEILCYIRWINVPYLWLFFQYCCLSPGFSERLLLRPLGTSLMLKSLLQSLFLSFSPHSEYLRLIYPLLLALKLSFSCIYYRCLYSSYNCISSSSGFLIFCCFFLSILGIHKKRHDFKPSDVTHPILILNDVSPNRRQCGPFTVISGPDGTPFVGFKFTHCTERGKMIESL